MAAEVIISMVEQQPVIWDKFCEEYKDRIARDKAWITVAKGVYEEWDSLSREEQTKRMNDIKLKWRNMKDSMFKFLKTKSGNCASKKKKYIHFEALTFLRTSTEKRSTSGNYEDDLTTELDPDESKTMVDERDSAMSTSSIDPPISRRKEIFKKPSLPPNITPFQTSLISSVDQAPKTIQSPKNDSEDADKFYLMSLLPDYKALNTAQKWEFRTYVANYFHNVYLTSTPTNLQQLFSQNYFQNSYSDGSSPTESAASPRISSPNLQ